MVSAGPARLDGAGSKAEEERPAEWQDCLSCRVTGTAVCLCLSGYLFANEYARPSVSPFQRRFTLVMAGGFAVLGAVRAVI